MPQCAIDVHRDPRRLSVHLAQRMSPHDARLRLLRAPHIESPPSGPDLGLSAELATEREGVIGGAAGLDPR